MVKGTALGLLDEQRTQSLFEQKILGTYVMPLATMTGSKAADERMVVLDGFPSRGRYPDGSPASADLILRTSLNALQAVIESVLGEKKRSDFAQLDALVTEYRAQGMRSEALAGEVVEARPVGPPPD